MQFELLAKHHDRKSFDCGNDEINHYLHTTANQHHKKGYARVHILSDDNVILGFYTLSSLSLEMVLKGYPRTTPAMLIGRMGVDKRYQGQGFSKLLLSHALKNIKQMSLTAGIMFAVIDAKNENLANYYTQFGFRKTDEPLRLILNVDSIE